MERRITLNDNAMKKKNEINSFENVCNEKQNSLASGIRMGLVIVLKVQHERCRRLIHFSF